MATDPRLELARRLVANGRGTAYNSPSSLQQKASQQYAALTSKKKASGGGGATGPGGWRGIVSAAFDNPIARTAFMPLQVLDVGRAAVISGLKEISDAIDMNDATKGSFGEFIGQTNRRIGFGDIIAEQGGLGNKWLDRIAGFAGDVAFDPTTYLTLGAGHLAGMSGRVNLASDIAQQGAKNVAAGRITSEALDELVQRAGKSGLGKLTSAERAAYNLPEAGVRFMGNRIAGTEKIAEGAGKLFAGFRTGVTDTNTWGKVFRTSEGVVRRAPDNLEKAYTKLATGVGKMTATEAAGLVASTTEKAAKGGAFAGTWGRVAHGLLNKERNPIRNAELIAQIESGNVVDEVSAATSKLLEDVRVAHAAATGDEIPKRANYFPHMWSREGRRLLAGDTELAKDLRRVLNLTVQEVNDLGFAMERKIDAGTYEIAGKQVTFNTGTIDDINRTLKREFPDLVKKDVVSTELPYVVGQYIKAVGESVGNKALINKLKELGVAIDSKDAIRAVVDEGATKAANAKAAKEFKKALDGGKAGFEQMRKAAKASVGEATKAVGTTLQLRLQGLVTRDARLLSEWKSLQQRLIKGNFEFDAAMREISDRELAIQQRLSEAESVTQRLVKRYEDDIAQAGADERMLTKDRLARRRQAKVEADKAQARVDELRAHLSAYEELKNQISSLKDEMASYDQITTKNLPSEVRDTVRHRTVAEQRLIDETGTKGTQVVDQAVRLGSKGEEVYGLVKRLKIDAGGASSILRQSVQNAGRYIPEQFQVELARLKNLADGIWGYGNEISQEMIDAEEARIMKMVDKLNSTKALLQTGRETMSASAVAKAESTVRTLEDQIKVAYDEFNAMVRSGEGGGYVVRAEAGFNEALGGTARQQAERQLRADVAKASKAVYDDAIANGFPENVAQSQAELFERTYAAVEASIRHRADAAGSGAYLVAANDALEKATYKARISTDYFTRRSVLLNELTKRGVTMTPAQARQIDGLIMAEVLRSEKRALQVQIGELIGNLDNYAANSGRTLDAAAQQTKMVNLAKQKADDAWFIISDYIAEIRQGMQEAGYRVFNTGQRETTGADQIADDFVSDILSGGNAYRTAEGAKTGTRQNVFRLLADTDMRMAIALVLTDGDVKLAKSLSNSKNMDAFLSKVINANSRTAKKAVEAEMVRLMAGKAQTTASKAVQWMDLSAQTARRQIDVLSDRVSDLERQIDGLAVTGGFREGAPELAASIQFFQSQADEYAAEIASLGRNITDEQRKTLNMFKDMFSEAADNYRQIGKAPRVARYTPEQIIEGNARNVAANAQRRAANAELKAKWTKIVDLEKRLESILNTGLLRNKVADVPGRQSIFTKGRNYIKAIDEDIAVINDRISRMTNAAEKKQAREYIRKLVEEKKQIEYAIEQATPLDERLVSAEVLLKEQKDRVKNLTGKGQPEIEAAAKTARLRAELAALAENRTAAEAKIAGQMQEIDVLRGGVRETYDATVKAVRDGSAAIEASRAEIENMIPAVEEVVRTMPKNIALKNSEDLNMVFNWLADAYDLLDPEGLAGRMMNIPKDLTPDMIKPNGMLGTVSHKELVAYLKMLPNDPAARTALALIYKAHEDAGRLLTLMGDREADRVMYEAAKKGELLSVLKQVTKDGFEELANSGLYVSSDVAEAMQRVVSLDTRASKQFIDTMNYYTDMWKSIKTTSPRFHIRNAMSATFMNLVAGVKFENMRLGARLFRDFERDPLNWLDNVPKGKRKYYEMALEAVFGSGGGQYGEIDNAATRISEKGVFRYSKMKGTTVEGTVRMGMALEMVLPKEMGGRGLSVDQAVGAITKYHFNYSQMSRFDRNMRAWVPFWTFMSRNLPLQIEQMWLNPRAYAIYNSFVRNMRDEQEGEIVPQWIKETGGFKLPFGEGLFATPDIGMNRVQQDIAQLRDPMRLAQNMNPVPKTLLELMMGRQFYKDIPISGDRYVQLQGPRRIAQPLLELIGQVERGPSGEPVISEKANYALMQLLPGLQETERIVAPSMESYKERLGQSRLSFFTGAPFTRVGPQQILSEQLRQKREAEKKKSKAKAIGKAVTQ